MGQTPAGALPIVVHRDVRRVTQLPETPVEVDPGLSPQCIETYAVLHEIPNDIWAKERKTFLSKGHPHLRVSPLAKRYGWGIHNNVAGKIALIAVESSRYRQLLDDPHTTKVKAFRSARA